MALDIWLGRRIVVEVQRSGQNDVLQAEGLVVSFPENGEHRTDYTRRVVTQVVRGAGATSFAGVGMECDLSKTTERHEEV